MDRRRSVPPAWSPFLIVLMAAAGCAGTGGPGDVGATGGSDAAAGPAGSTSTGPASPSPSAVSSGSSAACGRLVPSLEPARAAPGEDFRFGGGGFGGGCDDSNMPFRPEPPQQDVRIEMRQGRKAWHLATADAGGPPDYRIEAALEVPEDAEPGAAVVATDAGEDDPFGPLEVPFEVLEGGGPG